jgi:uncharacterized membrane protein YqhA
LERALDLSRGLALIAVVVLLLAALGAFVYGAAVFVQGVRQVVADPFPVGNRVGLFLLVVDLFLVGATLAIAGIGFYELFIGWSRREGGGPMPAWLQMRDLNDLKARVLAMIVLVASVSFVEELVDAGSGLRVLELGGGVALVIGAITAFLRFGGHAGGER